MGVGVGGWVGVHVDTYAYLCECDGVEVHVVDLVDTL